MGNKEKSYRESAVFILQRLSIYLEMDITSVAVFRHGTFATKKHRLVTRGLLHFRRTAKLFERSDKTEVGEFVFGKIVF